MCVLVLRRALSFCGLCFLHRAPPTASSSSVVAADCVVVVVARVVVAFVVVVRCAAAVVVSSVVVVAVVVVARSLSRPAVGRSRRRLSVYTSPVASSSTPPSLCRRMHPRGV